MDRFIIMGFLLIITALVLFHTGCSHAEDPPPEFRGETRTLSYGDERADRSIVGWTARGSDIRVTVEARLRTVDTPEGRGWILNGRTNKDLISMEAFMRPWDHQEARLITPRHFEVALDRDALVRIAAGEPIFMRLDTGFGDTVHNAMARFKSGFADFEGSSRAYIYRWLNPVALVGGDVVFRGRVRTSRGYELDHIFTDDDAGPHTIVDEHFRKSRFDFTGQELALASDRPSDPVYFEIFDTAGTRERKTASVIFRLVQIGVSLDEIDERWPTESCEPEVEACLAALDEEAVDTEVCGWANQVAACSQP